VAEVAAEAVLALGKEKREALVVGTGAWPGLCAWLPNDHGDPETVVAFVDAGENILLPNPIENVG